MSSRIERLADRLGWLVLLAAIAYVGAHVYLDLIR